MKSSTSNKPSAKREKEIHFRHSPTSSLCTHDPLQSISHRYKG